MKNPKVKAGRLAAMTSEPSEQYEASSSYNDFDRALMEESKKRQQRFVDLGLDNKRYSKATEMLAQSDFCMQNEPIPGGLEAFPAYNNMWFMRYADLYYPQAKGGPLYLDTPVSRAEIAVCEKKLQAYRARGVRYTYIAANEDATDAAMRLDPMSLPKGSAN